MDRLTTDNPRGNLEVALNMFYAKDGETWVRGGGPGPEYKDVSLFSFTRNLIKAHIPGADIPDDDNELSVMMCEWLFDDVDSAEGTIATLYTAAWAYAELRHKLKAYEDTGLTPKEVNGLKLKIESLEMSLRVACDALEKFTKAEQEGRLLVMPCKVGDYVWLIEDQEIYRLRVQGISAAQKPNDCILHFGGYPVRNAWGSAVGKTVFLTQEEAEETLKGGTVNGSTDV